MSDPRPHHLGEMSAHLRFTVLRAVYVALGGTCQHLRTVGQLTQQFSIDLPHSPTRVVEILADLVKFGLLDGPNPGLQVLLHPDDVIGLSAHGLVVSENGDWQDLLAR